MFPIKKRKLVDCSKLIFSETQLSRLINRVRTIQLLEVGWNNKQISEKLQISKQTIITIKKRCSFENIKSFIEESKPGRPIKYTKQDQKKILQAAKNLEFSPRKYVRSNSNGPKRTTIRKILKNNNLHPYRRKKQSRVKEWHKIARYEWCKLMQNEPLEYWESLLITDSKIFRLDGGYNPQNQRQYLTKDNKNLILKHNKDKKSKGIHYYGGLSHLGLTDLIEIKGSVTSTKYCHEILPKLIFKPQKRRKKDGLATEVMLFDDPSDFIFEQDHASSHDARETQKWLDEKGVDFIASEDAPSKLDDLWSIERVWTILTQQIYVDPKPETITELDKRVKNCWKNFSRKTLKKLIHEIPFRIHGIVKNKGGRIERPLGHCSCYVCLS